MDTIVIPKSTVWACWQHEVRWCTRKVIQPYGTRPLDVPMINQIVSSDLNGIWTTLWYHELNLAISLFHSPCTCVSMLPIIYNLHGEVGISWTLYPFFSQPCPLLLTLQKLRVDIFNFNTCKGQASVRTQIFTDKILRLSFRPCCDWQKICKNRFKSNMQNQKNIYRKF